MLFAGEAPKSEATDIYGFSMPTLMGETYDFEQLRGKVVVFVNTASKCGFTGQYAGLEKLWQQYHNKDVVIIGVPANNFAGQEPGTNDDIQQFCQVNYGVTFTMLAKTSVRGDDINLLYAYLTTAQGQTQPSELEL